MRGKAPGPTPENWPGEAHKQPQLATQYYSLISKFSLKIAEMFADFFPKFRKFCQNFAEFSANLTKKFRDFSKMQEQQEKIPNGQRGADSAGPTARGRQRRAGPVWPISARSSARP